MPTIVLIGDHTCSVCLPLGVAHLLLSGCQFWLRYQPPLGTLLDLLEPETTDIQTKIAGTGGWWELLCNETQATLSSSVPIRDTCNLYRNITLRNGIFQNIAEQSCPRRVAVKRYVCKSRSIKYFLCSCGTSVVCVGLVPCVGVARGTSLPHVIRQQFIHLEPSLFFMGFFFGVRIAIMDSSKTAFKPFCVRAEHST